MTNFLLALILLVLLINTRLFWTRWYRDQQERKADIEHLLRLLVVTRRLRTTEDIGQFMQNELAQAYQRIRDAGERP